MNHKLIDALKDMDEIEYMELFHCLSLARRVRLMLRTHNKDVNWLCEKLGIVKQDFKDVINGCYPFDLRTISRLDAIELSLEMEATKTEHGEWLTFPDYEYSKK